MSSQYSELDLRTRELSAKQAVVTVHTWNPFAGHDTNYLGITTEKDRQSTLSEGHPWHARERRHGDIGGPFRTERRYFSQTPFGGPKDPKDLAASVNFQQNTDTSIKEVEGSFFPMAIGAVGGGLFGQPIIRSADDSKWPQAINGSEYDLLVAGATAISRCKPTNSPAELSVGIAEILREGIPSIPGSKTWEERSLKARNAGSEYLNYQFGWAPLIAEIRDSTRALQNAEKIWRQYKRDEGHVVRRSYEFPVEKEVTQIADRSVAYQPTLPYADNTSTRGILSVIRHKRTRRWFDGAFSYHIPDGGEGSVMEAFYQGFYKARHVNGATIDPEVLWNLAPWSWFGDWFVNAGDIISNISDAAIDGLVLRYGYMMETSRVSDEITWVGGQLKDGSRPHFHICLNTEVKQRVKATPYGFGLTWDGFSPRQLAILAALGISRT